MSTTEPLTAAAALPWVRAWQLPAAAILLAVALGAFGWAPGILSAAWLAVVSPTLTLVDVCLHRLPNVLVMPGFALLGVDLAWEWASGGGGHWAAMIVAGGMGAFLLVANLTGALGMGDVKLAVVQAGCLGLASPSLALAALMIALLLGGGVSAVLLVRNRADRSLRLPFGPFLIAGFWAAALLAVGARVA